jgi:hypothetical protein
MMRRRLVCLRLVDSDEDSEIAGAKFIPIFFEFLGRRVLDFQRPSPEPLAPSTIAGLINMLSVYRTIQRKGSVN